MRTLGVHVYVPVNVLFEQLSGRLQSILFSLKTRGCPWDDVFNMFHTSECGASLMP